MTQQVKNTPAMGGDLGSIPESGRLPGGRHGNAFQYARLDNLIDRGAWGATVRGVAESDMTEVTGHVCAHTIQKRS